MNIIPKFAKGGSFDPLFTIYEENILKEKPSGYSKTPEKKTTSKVDDKGKATEKDLIDMLKDLDGIPNEMKSFVDSMAHTISVDNLLGKDPANMVVTYLQNLYKIRVMNLNKKRLDEAEKEVLKNDSRGEVAIDLQGNLLARNPLGKIDSISLDLYYNNLDYYSLLSVNDTINMRKYSPQLINDLEMFNIMSNSVGFNSFQDYLDKAKISLESSEYSNNALMDFNSKMALKGLKVLLSLPKKDREDALNSLLGEGIYDYSTSNSDNIELIGHYINYLTRALPPKIKTWASIKLGIEDDDKALKTMVTEYLLGQRKIKHNFKIDYQKPNESKNSNSSKKTSKESDPKEGFWRLIQSGKGGNSQYFNLLVDKGSMYVEGKLYGTTPGMSDQSLEKYISESGIGYLIKNNKSITFGDVNISTDSFNDVMINSGAGTFVVTLPKKPSGEVNFDILSSYTNIENELKKSGLDPKSDEYKNKRLELLKDANLDILIDPSTGELNKLYFGNFLLLEGYATSRAKGIDKDYSGYNNNKSISEFDSDFFVNVSSDDNLYKIINDGLSSKDKPYDIDPNNFYDFDGHDDIFKGIIYIPLNTNPINGMNADENDITVSTSKDYEESEQREQLIQKTGGMKSTNSNILLQ